MNIAVERILKYMQDNNLVESEEVELYYYGLYLMFSKGLHYCSIIVLGIMLGRVLEFVVFLGCYTTLRSFTGGYHANKPTLCFIISIIMMLGLHFTVYLIHEYIPIMMSTLSMIVIFIMSHCKTKENQLNKIETERNHKMSILVSVCLYCLLLLCYILNLEKICYSISYAMFYTSFFLVIALIVKEEGIKNE